MNTKIIFFDIDGTMLSHRTFQVSESTISAIHKARENGHLLFVNSGRTYAEIDDRVKGIGFDGYVCGCGTYINYQGEALLKATLSSETCQEIVESLGKYKLEAVLEGTNTIYFDYSSEFDILVRLREGFINYYQFNVKNWDSPDLSFDKFCIWCDPKENYRKFLAKWQEKFDYIDREGMIEIVPKGYSKASGIEFLINHLNISHENTYALGDGANDLPMLHYVKHSIGMGNSDSCVTDIVSFLTKDVDEDGVEHALRHFQII